MSARTFRATHTQQTKATPEQIWALWSDVDNWPDWDLGLEACRLQGPFAVGNRFTLRPRGSHEDITAELQVVVPNRRFSDATVLPFGTLQALHEIDTDSGETRVTHTIIAEIVEEKAEFFANSIWKNVEHGLKGSVAKLAALAEKS
jgi:uncharacterized protein YndB with AHSA1/START domain